MCKGMKDQQSLDNEHLKARLNMNKIKTGIMRDEKKT